MLEYIQNEIMSNLTGEKEKDEAYLFSELRKHKNDRDFPIIKDIILRLVYVDEKVIRRMITGRYMCIYNFLEEADFQLFKGQIDRSREIYEAVIRYAKEELEKEKTDENIILEFEERIEEDIYKKFYKPKKEIKHSSIPYGEVCVSYADFLMKTRRWKEASEWMIKALKFNPVSCEYLLNYAETLLGIGDESGFKDVSLKAFEYAYRPEHIFECYRNIGRHFAYKMEFKKAYVCYIIASLYSAPHETASMEFITLQQLEGVNNKMPSSDEIDKIRGELDFIKFPNERLIEICVRSIKEYYAKEDLLSVRYYLEILSEISGDKDANIALKNLDRMLFE